MEVLDMYYELPAWIEPAIGGLIIIIMGLFAYLSLHLISERKAGKQLPMFWEKIGEKMGYGKGYPKGPVKKKKKAAKKKKK